MNNRHFSKSRRNFLRSTLTLPVALAAGPSLLATAALAADAPVPADALPRRQLGKDGPQVTMLCMGGMMAALSPDYLDIAWSMGIRYFDTADCYLHGQSEKIVGQWLAKYPERRKEIFLVSKDHPHESPEQLLTMIDTRLAACGTTYLDAFYIHGLGPREYGDASLNWPKSDAFKKVAAQLKSSGKVKMVGFSCHDGRLPDYVNAAAEGGFLDLIMLAFNPFYPKGGPLDQALDAAHKAGLGLVAMKTMRSTHDVPKRLPELDKLGLSTHQAVLHAAWSDPRISVVCNMIDNVDQMQSSAAAARSYKEPLKFAHLELLRETILAGRRTMCTGCPACQAAARQTDFAFHDIARFVTYYEQDGNRDARGYYQALAPQHRDACRADLGALREACHFKTDYPEIVRRAERYFA
ncbi:MAG: aldo/keto reductase [Verrucomicrobiota bacterium]|jgi:predicted aldo/keto reductase-like oxidoreductase